ncbi:hypothetical protein [Micromonospora sp. WMMD980]|uniref:hypothetical protein n=1 Tax=Micromonospora sp. WMMD980 TaxID=3016088 RepID=UPI0024160D7A|nr:hypothetical protein [Micromonospora sp. WMMD980]MDG4801721.1 hypothetical protein [Micromonospora sp. WMMD980]
MTTARDAAKAEATGSTVTFEFDGESYEIEPSLTWDLDAMEAYEEGNLVTCVRLILGPAQYTKFKPKGAKRTVGDLGRLFNAIQEAGGAGN